MSMSDPIADMLTRIRNAQGVDKVSVEMPSSKVKVAIAQVLKDEGYITDYALREDGVDVRVVAPADGGRGQRRGTDVLARALSDRAGSGRGEQRLFRLRGRGRLSSLCQFLYPLRKIKVEHVDGYLSLARIIGLSAQTLYQRLCERSVSPCPVFERVLIACRCGKDYRSVFSARKLIHNAGNVCCASSRAHNIAGIACVDKKNGLARERGHCVFNIREREARPL